MSASASLAVDPFLLRGASLGAGWRVEREGAAGVVYHALNGLRIILIDFWSLGTKLHKPLFWSVIVLWIVLLVAFVPRHLMHVFGG